MNIHLLGTFHVEPPGEPVDITARASQLLLARLAMDPDRSQSRAKLTGLLWSESDLGSIEPARDLVDQ